MENTCKTCKWWDVNRPYPEPQSGHMRLCIEHCLGHLAEPDSRETSIWVGEDGIAGAFYTGPDFGCTLHQPKEAKE